MHCKPNFLKCEVDQNKLYFGNSNDTYNNLVVWIFVGWEYTPPLCNSAGVATYSGAFFGEGNEFWGHKSGVMLFCGSFQCFQVIVVVWFLTNFMHCYCYSSLLNCWPFKYLTALWLGFELLSWLCICWHIILCIMVIGRNILGDMLLLFLWSADI